ncbi:MAG: S1/P1 nuclease [Mucilaginibacter sp.]|uniref:S1/P1 nuclease n=1 Tax=Mucilaginibacter sp. TaxID=1882438 RepID=UPI0032631184
MKKPLFIVLILFCAIALISWGVTGHRTVAKIAENHLTPKTQLAIKELLGKETLPDVSTWADEIRSNPDYKFTGAYHYVNLPAGLNFEQFVAAIKALPIDNAYKIIQKCEMDIADPQKSKQAKVTALKFLVHVIGDIHQPMHVSHAEDKGGNDIQITFNGDGTNLHSLWDSGLIEQEGLSYQKMAVAYDTATPEQITKWQSDNLLIWLWESYQIAEILYKEAAENPKFEKEYYDEHLPVLQNRILKGGIRLAGVLNGLFDK